MHVSFTFLTDVQISPLLPWLAADRPNCSWQWGLHTLGEAKLSILCLKVQIKVILTVGFGFFQLEDLNFPEIKRRKQNENKEEDKKEFKDLFDLDSDSDEENVGFPIKGMGLVLGIHSPCPEFCVMWVSTALPEAGVHPVHLPFKDTWLGRESTGR